MREAKRLNNKGELAELNEVVVALVVELNPGELDTLRSARGGAWMDVELYRHSTQLLPGEVGRFGDVRCVISDQEVRLQSSLDRLEAALKKG